METIGDPHDQNGKGLSWDPGGSSPNLARKSRPRGRAASDFYCHRCIKKWCVVIVLNDVLWLLCWRTHIIWYHMISWYQMRFGWWCQMLVSFDPFPKAKRSLGPRTSQACWWRPTLNLLGAPAKCNRKHFRCRSRNFTRRRVSENSIFLVFLVFLVFLSTIFTYLYSSLRTRQPIEPISSHSCHSWHPELYPWCRSFGWRVEVKYGFNGFTTGQVGVLKTKPEVFLSGFWCRRCRCKWKHTHTYMHILLYILYTSYYICVHVCFHLFLCVVFCCYLLERFNALQLAASTGLQH